MDLTLVVLAGGLGSRFGGPKQLEAVGGGGATLMDYAVYDAQRAGFSKVVVVVRPDIEDDVRRRLETRFGRRLHATTVLQRMDDVPAPGRISQARMRPWGTAHGVLAARYAVKGPFAVVNGDDFYGIAAYRAVAAFLREPPPGNPPAWGLAGYRLEDTLSPHGGVNRAICRIDSAGWLKTIEEVRSIARTGDGTLRGLRTSGSRVLRGDEIVSMNCWAFSQDIFAVLDRAFERFMGSRAAASGELLLPDAVQEALAAGQARVRILDGGRDWFGLTHASDIEVVRTAMQRLVVSGDYPDKPWD